MNKGIINRLKDFLILLGQKYIKNGYFSINKLYVFWGVD